MAFSFDDTIKKLRGTLRGKEASMYGPIRDLFIHVLKYPAADVDIDTTGEGGRPDVTARAPSGIKDAKGKEVKIDWIVVEAKDENGCFSNTDSREKIFSKKAKYIGTNTAWFVMVEPEIILARQVAGEDFSTTSDIELPLDGLTRHEFVEKLRQLHHDVAGVPAQLKRFREGDTRLIAREKLSAPGPLVSTQKEIGRFQVTKKRFYNNIREVTKLLQGSTKNALDKSWPDVLAFQKIADDFGNKYQAEGRTKEGWTFDPNLLTIKAHPRGLEEVRQHQKDSSTLRAAFKKNPHVARLSLDGLPNFQNRTGAKESNLAELFSIETANLILARILLLRFFEDNGFFGEVKYVCNGGVKAFQSMREYFKSSYTHLLEEAYKHASQLYSAAFEETEMDWVLGINDQGLSNAIEWAMFQLSRYDFTTIKGDILTGIYDRFMDRDQRKKLGEFYTPPSIARYIVKRVGIGRDSRVLDPACGSGTFLIEAYREMIGKDIERGAADYGDALDALARIAGNDLNTFSSVLAQIQILWQVLGMRKDVEKYGFPDILVTGKVNSLVTLDQISMLDRFGEISQPIYTAVVGNPPYVRTERSAQALDKVSIADFERGRDGHKGVSSKLNAYALFIYKSLDSWCKPMDENDPPGHMGFIVPVSIFDANETKGLRELFKVGGRWTIREIIDLEIIYRQIFDADVLPAIIIIENRPATEADLVSIRLANHSCVIHESGEALPRFDLENLPEESIPYPYLFTPDGRIMTRLTPERLNVVKKLWECGTLRSAAKTYWQLRNKAIKGREVDQRPPEADLHNWIERQMIAGGIAFRNERAYKSQGHLVYKGENIISSEVQGTPVEVDVDLMGINDRSIWVIDKLLPQKGYAIAQVAHCVNAAAFDPTRETFTNTATLFFPRTDLIEFPFDLYFLSSIPVFFYAIAARMGVLRTLRSHIYPTNLGMMPWNDGLKNIGEEIEAMRSPLTVACRRHIHARDALRDALCSMGLATLKDHLRRDRDSHVFWSECFDHPEYRTEIVAPRIEEKSEDEIQIFFSEIMFEWAETNRSDLAEGLAIALTQQQGEFLDKSQILNMPIPVGEDERARWERTVQDCQEQLLEKEMLGRLNDLDQLVGTALGLDPEDISFIQEQLKTDPFLKGIRPRYPGTVTRKQGLRTGLSSSSRYQ